MIEPKEKLVGKEALNAILIRLKEDQDRQDIDIAHITPLADDDSETLVFGKDVEPLQSKRTIKEILNSLHNQ